MKTRIISGVIMAVLVAGFIAAGLLVSKLFICAFLMAVSAIAAFELTKNAAGIKSKAAIAGASVYSALFVFFVHGVPHIPYFSGTLAVKDRAVSAFALFTAYFLFAAAASLLLHKSFDMGKIFTLTCAVPVLALAFCVLGGIINAKGGIYYILLLLTFSSGCDMGAYFTGVTVGKHKLCPEISPKKTVEGAIGGIVTAIVLAVLFVWLFHSSAQLTASKIIVTALLTVPLCIVGMAGDLFASVVKRSVGLKDYGNLIPGHGGILDRFDSILLISPVLYIFILYGVM